MRNGYMPGRAAWRRSTVSRYQTRADIDIIRSLDLRILPYVLFLIVPILGRMSDPDEHIRLLSTSTFASLIKMVPLEAGLPDPPGFSAELLGKRDEERQFLMQLLDGRRAEQYRIPIEIKADLRQYQKDGVSWLAFLAKYQLHGILCDGVCFTDAADSRYGSWQVAADHLHHWIQTSRTHTTSFNAPAVVDRLSPYPNGSLASRNLEIHL